MWNVLVLEQTPGFEENSDRHSVLIIMNAGQVLNSRHTMNCTRLGGQRGLQQSQLRGTPVVGFQRNARLAGSRRGALSVRAEKVRLRDMHAQGLTAPPPLQMGAGNASLTRSGAGTIPTPSHRRSSVAVTAISGRVKLSRCVLKALHECLSHPAGKPVMPASVGQPSLVAASVVRKMGAASMLWAAPPPVSA